MSLIIPDITRGQTEDNFRSPVGTTSIQPAQGSIASDQNINVTVNLVNHFGGRTEAVAVQGNYVYVGFGPELVILDISNPALPIKVGSLLLADGLIIQDITVVLPYAYVAAGHLWVIDVSNPTQPVEVGYLPTIGDSMAVTVTGQYAYLTEAVGWGGGGGSGHGLTNYLEIVDISNPANPVKVNYLEISVGRNHAAKNILVRDNFAYVADPEQDGLDIVEISNPAQPVKVANWPGWAEAITAQGNYAYISGGYFGQNLQVVDISTPPNLRSLGLYQTQDKKQTGAIALSSHYVYVSEGPGWRAGEWLWEYGLRILDVADPTQPQPVGFYPTPLEITDIAIAGAQAYFTTPGQLHILDISTPATPTEVGAYQTLSAAYALYPADELLYIADDDAGSTLQGVKVTQPALPVRADDIAGQKITPFGKGYGYMVYGANLQIVSLKSISTVVSFYEPGEAIKDVFGQAPYIYLLLSPHPDAAPHLAILDASNPAQPREIGRYHLPKNLETVNIRDMAVVNNTLYLSHRSIPAQTHLFSMVNSQTLVEENPVNKLPVWDALTIQKGYAYLTTPEGLQIWDVTQPTRPAKVGATKSALLDTKWAAMNIVVDETYAYLLDFPFGLRVVNISNPAQPVEVASAGLPLGYPSSSPQLALIQDYIYVANTVGGLYIFQIKSP